MTEQPPNAAPTLYEVIHEPKLEDYTPGREVEIKGEWYELTADGVAFVGCRGYGRQSLHIFGCRVRYPKPEPEPVVLHEWACLGCRFSFLGDGQVRIKTPERAVLSLPLDSHSQTALTWAANRIAELQAELDEIITGEVQAKS